MTLCSPSSHHLPKCKLGLPGPSFISPETARDESVQQTHTSNPSFSCLHESAALGGRKPYSCACLLAVSCHFSPDALFSVACLSARVLTCSLRCSSLILACVLHVLTHCWLFSLLLGGLCQSDSQGSSWRA